MNQLLLEHLKRLNPTGKPWAELSAEEKESLMEEWNLAISTPEGLACSCPRHYCENNHNCKFCIATHRYYGSLPDCLRKVDDAWCEGVPFEKRHNVHVVMNPNQTGAITREEYAERVAEAMSKWDPDEQAAAKQRTKEWHDLVRIPKNVACRCSRTDCVFHGNCTKCIAVHRHYNGFPACFEPIYDKIDAAVQAYKAECEQQE